VIASVIEITNLQ